MVTVFLKKYIPSSKWVEKTLSGLDLINFVWQDPIHAAFGPKFSLPSKTYLDYFISLNHGFDRCYANQSSFHT